MFAGKLSTRGRSWILFLLLTFLSWPINAADLSKDSRRVAVVVMDGLRPDFVTPQNTPTLWKLAQEGVTFRNHHAVYLSSTHVNGSAIETGCYPNHNGMIANYDYRPAIESNKFVSTEQAAVIKKGDALSGGKYLTKPTIAQLVRAAGGRTAVAAGKTVGFLLDRQIDPGAAGNAVTLSAGEARPREALASIIAAAGLYPGFPMYRHWQRDAWTTKALTIPCGRKMCPSFRSFGWVNLI